jgi:hypothetical protein
VLRSITPAASAASGSRAETDAEASSRLETLIYVGALAVVAIVFCAAFIPYCTGLNWSDSDFTGWDYPIADRMSFAHRLYDAGVHTPIPPLSYVIVKLAGLGHPVWTTEMSVIIACQMLIALMFVLGGAAVFGRWPAFVGGIAGLGFFAGFSKTIAYDATAQLFAALAGLAIAAYVSAQRAGDRRATIWSAVAAGLGAAGGLLCKQSLGLFLVPAMFLAVGLLGSGDRYKRFVPLALAILGWTAALIIAMAPWVNITGMFTVGILGGAETKGGSAHLIPLFLEFVRYGALTIAIFAIINGMMQSKPQPSEIAPDLASAPTPHRDMTILGIGVGALLLLAFAVALPWPQDRFALLNWAVVELKWVGDYGCPLILWATLFLSMREGLWPTHWRFPRGAPAAAVSIVYLAAAVGMSLSVLNFRWTEDNNPLIMSSIALAAAYIAAGRRPQNLRIALSWFAAAMFVVAGWSVSRIHFFVASHSNWPSTEFVALGGASTRPEDDPWREVAHLIKATLRPTQTAIVLPEDPHTEALFERPRPPLQSGVIFVDTLQADDEKADREILAQNLPSIIVIGPTLVWHQWFHALRRGSPAEQFIDWVTRSVIPAHYDMIAQYRLAPAQYISKGDLVKVYRLRDDPSSVSPAGNSSASWLKLAPGTSAYARGDGDGATQATVCDSPESYANFAAGAGRGGCHEVAQGDVLTVGRPVGTLDQDGTKTTIVAVNDAAGATLGVIDASRLRPRIPVGTMLETAGSDGQAPRLWYDREQSLLSWDSYLSSPAQFISPGLDVEVLDQHAYDGAADVYVKILTGDRAGTMGWTSDLTLPSAAVPTDHFAVASEGS